MDMSPDMLIGLALNLLGYIGAGGLCATLYSMWRGRKRAASTRSDGDSPSVSLSGPSAPGSLPEPRLEFVRLVESRHAERSEGGRDVKIAGARRNRTDTFQLARKMIDLGAAPEKVRGLLPISEAELALLRRGHN
ncbi:MAG TPA: hypothetical protein VN285_09965 [Candidatus Deferrimicrobium sp.]|nr:hypothetical protein [Candidatus Deferrimicrobium sp.]